MEDVRGMLTTSMTAPDWLEPEGLANRRFMAQVTFQSKKRQDGYLKLHDGGNHLRK